MNRLFYLALAILIFFTNPIAAQNNKTYKTKAEKVVKKYMDSLSLVGMSVSIIKDSKIVYKNSNFIDNKRFSKKRRFGRVASPVRFISYYLLRYWKDDSN